MKKLIISSLFIFLATSASIKANTKVVIKDNGIESIASDVLRQFGYSFYRATNVNWTINNTYQKATFLLNGKVTYALYDLNNRFLVATQLTNVSELPERVKASLTSEYAAYKVTNVLKVIERPSDFQYDDDTNSYWLDLVSEKQHLVAIAVTNSSINIVKKENVQ
ncbi:hypothetical protein [Pedobacter cryophilus]|uniref:Beta-lactamase-inhibitor-like PepSY-like domain-containing protein n=1 Tax=Pedobacter cryophilus TaxID=2571271 RepID=A0A4U1BVX8_9SPHI|nr:hypothetical protein [Pedobacter cryophilus]TKB96354.1 hypothetical protein FA046_14330 [Pedobacter cryophilus]